jgi:hypothetical protein
MADLTAREQRVFDRIVAGIAHDQRRYIPHDEAVAAFRGAYEAFNRVYTLINLAALPFAIPVLLSLFAFDLPLGVSIALLIPLVTLSIMSYRQLLAFRQGMRFTLETIAKRNIRAAQAAAPGSGGNRRSTGED